LPVELEVYGQLTDKLPRRQTLKLEKRTTIAELAAQMGLKKSEVGMVVVNGKQAKLGDQIPADCRLCLFPPLMGG
jgi:hypothetical protein